MEIERPGHLNILFPIYTLRPGQEERFFQMRSGNKSFWVVSQESLHGGSYRNLPNREAAAKAFSVSPLE